MSPTTICAGVITVATINGRSNPILWYRSFRPRSRAAAYTQATRNPVTMNAARIMWMVSTGVAGLNIATSGCGSVTLPLTGVYHCGWCAHREDRAGDLCPGAGQAHGVGITVDTAPLCDEDQRRESDPEAGEDDVPA